MTKEEFKNIWESPNCNITWDDIAVIAKDWGLFNKPKCAPMELVRYKVLKTANCKDAEEYKYNQ